MKSCLLRRGPKGAKRVRRGGVAKLMDNYDQVWRW